MEPEHKSWIDNASLASLLAKWRFAKIGDPLLQGETGKYYAETMFALRNKNPEEWVAASKDIGWR